MRVSRTRFSKRRIKRKTEFPIVAVVEKKRKAEYVKSLSFGIVNNQAGATKQQKERPAASNKSSIRAVGSEKQSIDRALNDGTGQPLTEGTPYGGINQKDSRFTQKNIASKPIKKSRATIDYKNVVLLRNLITAEGKILPRRISKLTAKQQRNVQKAIKSARIMGLIPFINKSRPF